MRCCRKRRLKTILNFCALSSVDFDIALIKADVADTHGNLTYNMTARNFGPIMCMAATTTIVQAREIVNAGDINPERVITPGIFVDRVIHVPHPEHEDDLLQAGRSYS